MADGTVGQSFKYLTAYLKEENVRLEAEKQQEDLDQSISMVSKKFQQLGPDASPEDARRIFFDSITAAAQSGTSEAIPLIQGLYNESSQYLAGEKATRSEEAFKKELAERFGVSGDPNLTGQAAGQLFGLELQTRKDVTMVGPDKKNYLQSLKLQPNGSYALTGDPIQLTAVGYEEEFTDFSRRELFKHGLNMQEIKARGEAGGYGGVGGMQKTTYVDQLGRPIVFSKLNGYMIQVPDPNNPGQVTFMPTSADTVFDKVQGSQDYALGEQKYLEHMTKAAWQFTNNKAGDIAKTLIEADSEVADLLSDEEGMPAPNAAETIYKLARQKAKNPNKYQNRLQELANKTEDPEAVLLDVKEFMEARGSMEAGQKKLFQDNTTPREQELVEVLSQNGLNLQTWKGVHGQLSEALMQEGTKKYQIATEFIRAHLGPLAVGADITPGHLKYLSPQQTADLIKEIQKAQK